MLTIYNGGEVDIDEDTLSTSLSAKSFTGKTDLYEVMAAVQKAVERTFVFWGDTYKYHEINLAVDSTNHILSNEDYSLMQHLFKDNFNRDLKIIRHFNVDYDVEMLEEHDENVIPKNSLFLTILATQESNFPWLEYGRRKYLK